MGWIDNTALRALRTGLLLALLLTLQACSQLSFVLQDKPARVKTLVEKQQFYGALDLIDATPSSDPDFAALSEQRKDVLRAIDDYEKTALANTDNLIAKSHWKQALAQLDEALSRLPASKPLTTRHKEVQKEIEYRNFKTHLQLAMQQARFLPEEIALLRDLQQYSDDDAIDSVLAYRMRDSETAREILLTQAKRNIRKQSWSSARQYAELAHSLKADGESRKLLAEIDKHMINERLDLLRDAINRNDLLAAQKIASSLDRGNARAAKLIDQLNQKVTETITNLSRIAQTAYTKGELDQAIQHWQQALRLAPESEDIKNQLQRAKTFKQNYQRFKSDP